MPVCIRCAFPICTTPKPLYYTKVTPTAIFFFWCKASKDLPSANRALLPAISSFVGSKVDKKEGENRNNGLQLMGSIFITFLQQGQHSRITMEPKSVHLSHFLFPTSKGELCNPSSRGTWPVMVQSFNQRFCIVSQLKLEKSTVLVHSHQCFHCKQRHIQIREVINKIIVHWHYFLSESSKRIA